MKFRVGPNELGITEQTWAASKELAACPAFDAAGITNAVVLAPHPDDEVLALGGTMQLLAHRGCDVSIVAITDGEASHPLARNVTRDQLAAIRAREREAALHRLGLAIRVTRLHVADGGVARETHLADWLEPLLAKASHCFAPWELDGHPDHDATGRAAIAACSRLGIELIRYPIWAWHWATNEMPWSRARRIELDGDAWTHKCGAIEAYRSQLSPLDDAPVVLPPEVVARFRRSYEVVFA